MHSYFRMNNSFLGCWRNNPPPRRSKEFPGPAWPSTCHPAPWSSFLQTPPQGSASRSSRHPAPWSSLLQTPPQGPASWSSLSNRLDFNRLFANLSGSKYLIVRAILQVRDLMVRLRHVLASLVKCSSSLQQVAFILSIIQFPWPLSLSRGQLPLQDH